MRGLALRRGRGGGLRGKLVRRTVATKLEDGGSDALPARVSHVRNQRTCQRARTCHHHEGEENDDGACFVTVRPC